MKLRTVLVIQQVCTDGSTVGGSVGAAGIILVNGKLAHQLKFKLHGHCSNNQAEQIAILKVLEKLEELQVGRNGDKRTDSKITMDLLQNTFKRNRLIEPIRNKIITLTHLKWTMHFGWVKGHAVTAGMSWWSGIAGEVIRTREKENGLQMWQQQRTNAGKGEVTKAVFPSVRNRLRQKIPIFPEFATVVTGHGKLRSYLHRFGLIDNPMCPCKEEEQQQTTDHLIF